MIGHRAVEPEAAEPAVSEVEMHFLAQPPLRADAERVADNQHADHQLGVDRWPPRLAVVRPQMLANARQVDEPVDRAQQMIRRDVILEAEAVKQRLLHHRPLAHHQPVSRFGRSIESEHHPNFKRAFFNTIRPSQSFNDVGDLPLMRTSR